MKKRIVICGFGFMGQTHAANIFKSSGLTLAAIVNPTAKENKKPVTGNQDTGTFDWKLLDDVPFYPTLQQAFDSCEFDAAVICSPTVFHASAAIDCLRHGKDVFLEKPLCSNMAEAENMIAAANECKKVFHIGHCLRFFAEYSYLRSVCKSEKYGKLKHLKLMRRTGVPSWGAWKDKDTTLKSVTGPVFDLNIHDVDFALSLTGTPENISAAGEPGGEKLFTAQWQSSSGTTIMIEGGFSDQPAYPFRAGYTAFFENATLEYNSIAANPLVLSTGEKSETVTLAPQDGYQLEMQAFEEGLFGRNTDHCTPEEAACAVDVCRKVMDLL